MRAHLSLTQKVLIFVSVPLLIQLCLIAALAHLQKQAEDALQVSEHSKQVSDLIHEITSNIFDVVHRYRSYDALENIPLDDEIGKAIIGKVWLHYDELKELTKDQPEILSTVIASERVTKESLEMYRQVQEAFRSLNPKTIREKILIARRLRQGRTDKVVKQLIIVADEQRKLYDKAPEEQAVFRRQAQTIMFALGVFDLLLGILLAVFLTKGITERLQRVSANTTNLAAGLPLHPMLSGTDEIATLDQVFHKMANDVKEAARKERAVIDHALDFICTLDANNRLIAANPASRTLLNKEPDDLIGKYAIDLVSESQKEKAAEFFDNLKRQDIFEPIELGLKTADGNVVETAWAAHWSKAENSTFCVVHDITERKRVEKLKQELTAMITHDLRSPLNTVVNVFEFFEPIVDKADDERAPRYLKMGRRNTARMLSLINDLLDIEKIKSGNMNIEINDFPIADCFTSCEELTAAAANEVGVKLEFENCNLKVSADQNLIDRVMTNLVSNAIRYSPEGTTIKISCTEENSDGEIAEGSANSSGRRFATVAVIDQGKGIPKDELPLIFERFVQLKSGNAKNAGGSGLGLTICKAIIDMHGGKIWAESSESGSTFSFSLPRSKNSG